MKSFKNFISMFLVLFTFWLLLNGSIATQVLIVGAVISALIPALFYRQFDLFSEIKLNPKAILFQLIYFVVFMKELIVANIDVARRVLSPSLPIGPGIVKVQTKLKSKIGRMILANSITLTPGTFTIEMEEDNLYIHWIDVKSSNMEEATREIVSKFEKYLEVIYG